MTPETLDRVGRALYGALYRTALAADLGVHHRTVRRWTAGECAIPTDKQTAIAHLVTDRRSELAELAAELTAEKNRVDRKNPLDGSLDMSIY